MCSSSSHWLFGRFEEYELWMKSSKCNTLAVKGLEMKAGMSDSEVLCLGLTTDPAVTTAWGRIRDQSESPVMETPVEMNFFSIHHQLLKKGIRGNVLCAPVFTTLGWLLYVIRRDKQECHEVELYCQSFVRGVIILLLMQSIFHPLSLPERSKRKQSVLKHMLHMLSVERHLVSELCLFEAKHSGRNFFLQFIKWHFISVSTNNDYEELSKVKIIKLKCFLWKSILKWALHPDPASISQTEQFLNLPLIDSFREAQEEEQMPYSEGSKMLMPPALNTFLRVPMSRHGRVLPNGACDWRLHGKAKDITKHDKYDNKTAGIPGDGASESLIFLLLDVHKLVMSHWALRFLFFNSLESLKPLFGTKNGLWHLDIYNKFLALRSSWLNQPSHQRSHGPVIPLMDHFLRHWHRKCNHWNALNDKQTELVIAWECNYSSSVLVLKGSRLWL